MKMNSEEVLQIATNIKPVINNKEYDSIKDVIKYAASQGGTDAFIGFTMISVATEVRLRGEGYLFYTIGDNYLIPKMYRISWREEPKKKKWYQKLFR